MKDIRANDAEFWIRNNIDLSKCNSFGRGKYMVKYAIYFRE